MGEIPFFPTCIKRKKIKSLRAFNWRYTAWSVWTVQLSVFAVFPSSGRRVEKRAAACRKSCWGAEQGLCLWTKQQMFVSHFRMQIHKELTLLFKYCIFQSYPFVVFIYFLPGTKWPTATNYCYKARASLLWPPLPVVSAQSIRHTVTIKHCFNSNSIADFQILSHSRYVFK